MFKIIPILMGIVIYAASSCPGHSASKIRWIVIINFVPVAEQASSDFRRCGSGNSI